MPITLIAPIILGCIIYILSMILAFSEESSALSKKRQEALMRFDLAERKAAEQQSLVEQLVNKISKQRSHCDIQKQWITKLNGQLAKLKLAQAQKLEAEEMRKKSIHINMRNAQLRGMGE